MSHKYNAELQEIVGSLNELRGQVLDHLGDMESLIRQASEHTDCSLILKRAEAYWLTGIKQALESGSSTFMINFEDTLKEIDEYTEVEDDL